MAASVFRRFARTTLVEGAILDACRQGKKGQRSRRLSKRRTQLRSTRRNAATPRQRHTRAPSQHALRCRQATRFCSGVVDVRERIPGALGVARVDQDLHRARSDVKATCCSAKHARHSRACDPPGGTNAALGTLAHGASRTRRQLTVRAAAAVDQRDRVRGLEDGDELRGFAGQVMTRGTSPERAGESRRSPSCRARSRTPGDCGR